MRNWGAAEFIFMLHFLVFNVRGRPQSTRNEHGISDWPGTFGPINYIILFNITWRVRLFSWKINYFLPETWKICHFFALFVFNIFGVQVQGFSIIISDEHLQCLYTSYKIDPCYAHIIIRRNNRLPMGLEIMCAHTTRCHFGYNGILIASKFALQRTNFQASQRTHHRTS